MYCVLFAIILIAIFSCIFCHFRRKKIICKIECMKKAEKCSLLDEFIQSFGYRYYCYYGIFSSTLDAWQKKAGYTYLYDYMAPRFGMVFDSLPIYFDYRGKTWLIEFWKGQYGINTGAEIGIYHADRIIPKEDYKTTVFDPVGEDEMLHCSFQLYNSEGPHLRITGQHWWLTAFSTGCFSNPAELRMEITLRFPNQEMLSAFRNSLYQAGFPPRSIMTMGLTLAFSFTDANAPKPNIFTRFWRCFAQRKNKIFCRLYLFVTRHFHCTEDRILYLYYYLPFAFRKIFRLHRFHKRCHKKRLCMRKKL